MALDYGLCMLMMDDMGDPARTISGNNVLIQDVYHLLVTVRGTMATDPEFGFGLSDQLLSGQDTATASALPSSIESALEEDDRIESATIEFIKDEVSGVVNLDMVITPTAGPSFAFVGTLASLLEQLTNG